MLIPPKMAPVSVESTWYKYVAFLNSFHSRSNDSYEDLKDKIDRNEVCALYNQAYINIYIYIYI